MDIAIEIKDAISEKLVSIEDIKDEIFSSISVKDKKFICSQCGEYVAYVVKSRHKPYFRHANDGKCDLRVNNGVYNSIDDKLGLNLYISQNGKKFDLLIGFNRIDPITFKTLVNIEASIEINGQNSKDIYKINNYNFVENEKNYKKISTVAEKYTLNYTKKSSLQRIFGNEVIGIRNDIGLFKVSNSSGRLIRVNEEVILDTEYYLLKNKNVSLVNNDLLNFEELGSLNLESSQVGMYIVGKVKFKVNNNYEFQRLSKYLREVLKVKLVNNESELITLWPPTIKDDIEEFYYEDNEHIFAKFKSSMCNPSMAVHFNNEKVSNVGIKIEENTFINKILLEEYKIGISFNENNYLLSKIYNRKNKFSVRDLRKVEMSDAENKVFIGGINEKEPYKNKLIIKTNFYSELMHIKNNQIYKKIIIDNEKEVNLENVKLGDSIIWKDSCLSAYNLYFKDKVIKKIEFFDDEKMYLKLKKLKGNLIKNELLIRFLLNKISKKYKVYSIIKEYKKQGAFPRAAYKYLKGLEGGFLNDGLNVYI